METTISQTRADDQTTAQHGPADERATTGGETLPGFHDNAHRRHAGPRGESRRPGFANSQAQGRTTPMRPSVGGSKEQPLDATPAIIPTSLDLSSEKSPAPARLRRLGRTGPACLAILREAARRGWTTTAHAQGARGSTERAAQALLTRMRAADLLAFRINAAGRLVNRITGAGWVLLAESAEAEGLL
jgi:hypothetical protein